MTLIRDLIDIPDHVQRGDFVLKLTEDIQRPESVLDNYVVTDELVRCYDAALALIRGTVQGRTSKATFLHGSFGSGKSHFMAVLHLILQGNAAARSIPQLASVIATHNDWLAGKKFLLVPYHMIGAHDMESGVLGGYVDFIRRTHPEAPVPPVYVSAAIINQAVSERASYGDELFFSRLNAGGASGGDSGWGDLDAAWDSESFAAAVAAPPDSEEHLRLVSTLLRTVATAHADVIGQRGGNFVRFDKGLEIVSQHAAALGYDALILFLDELILWLATNSADLGFVRQQAAKLTNLVEAQSANRPIPLISFVARQRDLRELVGDHVPGAEKLSFSDSLDWQQGRFDTITLEDRNLPAIAEKRVLRCKTKAARDELNAAFKQTARMKDNVMNILLTREGDSRMFQQVYPFSPALVQTLIAVSSVLQRERTALKVMMQLLVDQRDTLKVGDLVPVGDLFDVVAHGDEAFSQDMAVHFDNAKRLYHQKLLPVLEKQHNIRREDVEQLPYDDPRRTAFRNDDRLVKTLLLSALVPEVESLRGLTPERLAALNHGTIKTPIPGKEGQEVLRRCRNWAASVGEIRVSEDSNPTISVQLSGVDTASIIAKAEREDNHGNRVRRIRQMLYDQLDVSGEQDFEQYHEFLWRNTRRNCTVIFRNIRELPEASLANPEGDWKLIIDYPFDEPGHGPRDDLSTLQRFVQSHPEGAKTIGWVPSFFSHEAQRDLGTLVILEHILTGERFGQYASDLSPQDRQSARSILESQRSQLTMRVQIHLEAAYGLVSQAGASLDTSHELEPAEHFVSLKDGFDVRPPAAANLKGAMEQILFQALDSEFPAGPYFETEIKTSILKKVHELVIPATEAPDGRCPVDKTQRMLLRQVANPLRIGDMAPDATHFVLEQHWKTHFATKAAAAGGAKSVSQLRDWIDEPQPMGLPKEAQNLILLVYAAQTSQSFYLHGGPYEATLSSIPDNCELRTVDLPDQSEWDTAYQRAGRILGVTSISPLRSAANVGTLVSETKRVLEKTRRACQGYAQRLREHLARLGIEAASADRLKTATATQQLLDKLTAVDGRQVIGVLAAARVATSETAMCDCIGKAAELEGNLDTVAWDVFDAIGKLTDGRAAEAEQILMDVRESLRSDEHAVALAPALKGAQARAVRLLSAVQQSPPAPGQVTPAPPAPTPKPGKRIVGQDARQNLTVAAAIETLQDLSGSTKPGQAVRVNLNWVVEEGGQQ